MCFVYIWHLHIFHTPPLNTPQEHSKVYGSDREELTRHIIWQANRKYVDEHNAHAEKFGFTLGMNQFADLVRFPPRQPTTGFFFCFFFVFAGAGVRRLLV